MVTKTWVLDCSLAAASFLPGEGSQLADRFLESIGTKNKVILPSLWWYEFGNVLLVSQRRKRITETQAKEIVSIFQSFSLEFDQNVSFEVQSHTQELALRNDLSFYDASYLELCIRKGAGIASLDDKLIQVAGLLKIETFR